LKNILKSILFATLIVATIVSCGKQETDELKQSFESSFEADETKAITVMRQLGFDDQGIPGNTEPRPFCFNTGGNCVCDVVVKDAIKIKLAALDNAIENNTQASFFKSNHHADVFELIPGESIKRIQKKLEKGQLKFKNADVDGELWYVAVKPQHFCKTGLSLFNKAVITVPVVEDSDDGHNG